jgi:hypothetical protein
MGCMIDMGYFWMFREILTAMGSLDGSHFVRVEAGHEWDDKEMWRLPYRSCHNVP